MIITSWSTFLKLFPALLLLNVPVAFSQGTKKTVPVKLLASPVDTVRLPLITVHGSQVVIDTGSWGIDDAFQTGLKKRLRYPQVAIEAHLQGLVEISFVLGKDSSISDIKVLKGFGGGCVEMVVKSIKEQPPLTPVKRNGKRIRRVYILRVRFRINEEENRTELEAEEKRIKEFETRCRFPEIVWKEDQYYKYYDTASVQMKNGNYYEAYQLFSTAISYREWINAYYGRAQAEYRLKKYQEACEDLQKINSREAETRTYYSDLLKLKKKTCRKAARK